MTHLTAPDLPPTPLRDLHLTLCLILQFSLLYLQTHNFSNMTLLNDSLSAYLTPLLQKHTAGKAIIYDDLIQSWKAAEQVMKADFDPAVSVRTMIVCVFLI